MSDQPFYHQRPNKFIDRELFVQVLRGLSHMFPISNYHYYGFGSFYFDDFKIMHNQLDISKLTSIELDDRIYKRALFNKPLNCIDVLHTSSTEFITEFDPEDLDRSIFWLDYTSAGEIAEQFMDYCNLLQKLSAGDIVRITLNAHVANLGYEKSELGPEEKQEKRQIKLRELLGDFVPMQCTAADFTSGQYPSVLMRCIQNATFATLKEGKYQKEFLLPLYATTYADNQRMLTFTGIVLDNHDDEDRIKTLVTDRRYCCCDWKKLNAIDIPALTPIEIAAINKKLPVVEGEQLIAIKDELPGIFTSDAALKSYIAYYKYYPSFHHVVF